MEVYEFYKFFIKFILMAEQGFEKFDELSGLHLYRKIK